MNHPRGAIFYEGPSLINGAPIVGVVTYQSTNGKTGKIGQTWILHQGHRPTEAVKLGCDDAVCGTCPLRGDHGQKRACYVILFQGPRQVWESYKAGKYPQLSDASCRVNDGKLRLGAYGDPTAIPLDVTLDMMLHVQVNKSSGYTQRWRDGTDARWKRWCMASCHNGAEVLKARAAGWSTYRGLRDGEEPMPLEIMCPSNSGVKCRHCMLCAGNRGAQRSLCNYIHGNGKKHY